MGGFDRDEDVVKDSADANIVSKPRQRKDDGDDNRIGKLARTESEEITQLVGRVAARFNWLRDEVGDRMETLRGHLEKKDTPPWHERIAAGAMALGLTTGGGLVAKFLGGRLAAKIAGGPITRNSAPIDHVTKDFVERMFSGGTTAAINAGGKKLGEGNDNNQIGPFIDAQKSGANARYMATEDAWEEEGSKKIHTIAAAQQILDTLSRPNIEAAAEEQYAASRDAWVSYLAQARFGTIGQKDGAKTTDMSTQQERDQKNELAPARQWLPLDTRSEKGMDAPSMNDAARGNAQGVLTISARVPRITEVESGAYVMHGKPTVDLAILNGVNEVIRKQYQGVALANMRIPRQVHVAAEWAPSFTLNLDEAGKSNILGREEGTWLRYRAIAGNSQNAKLDDRGQVDKGRQLLLEELTATEIVKQVIG